MRWNYDCMDRCILMHNDKLYYNTLPKILDRIKNINSYLDPWMGTTPANRETQKTARTFIKTLKMASDAENCWVFPMFINPTSSEEICFEFCNYKNGRDVSFYIEDEKVTFLKAFNSILDDMEDGEVNNISEAVKMLKWMKEC
jgi:hypothetical protein